MTKHLVQIGRPKIYGNFNHLEVYVKFTLFFQNTQLIVLFFLFALVQCKPQAEFARR